MGDMGGWVGFLFRKLYRGISYILRARVRLCAYAPAHHTFPDLNLNILSS